MKVVALAGGVGGAKLVAGLAETVRADDLTIIVNTGDDFDHLGLRICPDLDTVCYTLAGIADPEKGWGREEETWHALQSLEVLGGPTWFRLGDRDLGTHLERKRLLEKGLTLSQITRRFCKSWGIAPAVIPMTDDSVSTWVLTDEGELPFQEYFVHRECRPQVSGFRFVGSEAARPAPEILERLDEAALIVVCPSNPWVSIDPILSIPGIVGRLKSGRFRNKNVIAVSPIVGGKAVKGPVAKMYSELGYEPSALVVAEHYEVLNKDGLLSGFVLDDQDAGQASAIRELGMETLQTNTLMFTTEERHRLATEVIGFAQQLVKDPV
jgi:LPPG:FO 2-phospho-L-lactate transferase